MRKVLVISFVLFMLGLGWINTYSRTVDITHGPLVGGVTESSVDIMARTNQATSLQVKYDIDVDVSDGLLSGSVPTVPASDFTGHILLSGLSPDTLYYYQFVGVSDTTLYQFKTFPLPVDTQPFIFNVVVDLKFSTTTPAPVYTQLATDSPAFVLQIGDFDHQNPAVSGATVTNWRTVIKRVIRDSVAGTTFHQEIGSRFPLVHIWDDHDYCKNESDKRCPYKPFAWQSYDEFYPHYNIPSPSAGRWHSFTYGALAEFFVLDLRSQRDPNLDPDGPEHSILDGDNLGMSGQKQWLFDSLLASTRPWKFIISSSTFNPLVKERDTWGNFLTEQNELLTFIATNNIIGVILLSGDIHSGGAIGTNPLPEMSIPHTNMGNNTCTTLTGSCGVWSIGVIDPDPVIGGGYGRITVTTGGVLLEAVGQDGTIRLTYGVTP